MAARAGPAGGRMSDASRPDPPSLTAIRARQQALADDNRRYYQDGAPTLADSEFDRQLA